MKRILFTLMCLVASWSLLAVPANRSPREVRLSDGRVITAFLMGDEDMSWLQTSDGYIIEPVGDGRYELTSMHVTSVEHRARCARARSISAPRYIGSQATAPLPSVGAPKIPVILVNFTDSVFHVASTDEGIREYYDLFCNGTRDGNLYKGHGSYGSIRDYFVEQSGGLFSPEFVVYGPVTLSKKEESYASDVSGMSKDAVRMATEKYSVDWSVFDNRGKNQVDMVFIIFAGCGANSTDDRTHHVWPNERAIGKVTIDDGVVNFVCSGCCSENTFGMRGDVPIVQADGIGVMCHEMSHALGLPDFYDTSYKAFGMDTWSLMDYGCYGDNGYIPCSYNAYELDFMGWRPLQTLTEKGTYTLDPISKGGQGYKIVNDENSDEYYVLEYRDSLGWDYGIFKRTVQNVQVANPGLQVTHVDYLKSAWNNNAVNTTATHQRMTIIAANNRYIGTTISGKASDWKKTWMGNLFPYEYKDDAGVAQVNNSLTSSTVPAAEVYTSAGFMNKDIYYINRLPNHQVSFYFGNDAVGIRGVEPSVERTSSEECLYDLFGRPVTGTQGMRSGIYVTRSGRKVFIVK